MARFIVIRESNDPKIINMDEICIIENRGDEYLIRFSNNNSILINKQDADRIFSAIGQRI